MEKTMLAVEAQNNINSNLQTLAKRTKLTIVTVTRVVEEYSKDLNLSRIPSSTETLPTRLAENLFQILSYHKLGWSHGKVVSHLRKTKNSHSKTASNLPVRALFKGQSRLQNQMKVGMQIAERLQSQLQIIEHSHKLENQLMLTKVDILVRAVEDLKKENDELKSELQERTSSFHIIAEIKKWILDLL
tara:strand:- start:844 stop:1407 length:564 start_codon:yes stop_codon:yes gene_type:complete